MKKYLFLGVFAEKKCLHKILLIMRLTTFFLILATLQSMARGYGQSSIIKFSDDAQTLSSVIEAIENQSDFKIFYKTDQVDVTQAVSLASDETTVASALTSALKGTNLTYVVMDKLIVFAPTENIGQPTIVTGTIKDATTNEPLIGVNIVIEGSNTGVISDLNGKYSIEVKDENAVLVFSYVGYNTEKVAVASQTTIHINLVPDITNLDEVVVIGYGSQKKSDLTGAISSVKGKDLLQLPMQRVDQALQGRAAGVMVVNQAGAPGSNTTIRIRGMNSISGGNNALIVIDGIQGDNLNSLNPNDIESLEVLKDASATAIYGSKGANGVILITTKTGKTGKSVLEYSINYGFQKLRHKLPVMGAVDYALIANEIGAMNNKNGTPPPFYTEEEIQGYRQNGGTDWQDEVYRTAPIMNHQLSASGGSEKIKYMISGGYLNQEGILINTNYKRFSLRANVSADISKKISVGLNWAGSKESGNSTNYGNSGTFLSSPVNLAPRWSPTVPVYNSEGFYSEPRDGYGPYDTHNPVAGAREPDIRLNTIRNTINAYLDYRILEGLTLKITGGAITRNRNDFSYYNAKTYEGRPKNGLVGYGTIDEGLSTTYQNTNLLSYDKTLGANHHFTAILVAEQLIEKFTGSNLDATNFLSDKTGIYDLSGAGLVHNYSTRDERVLNSYLSRINYVFAGKYLLTASIRADGSSVFGANNKWGYFPSGSIAWRASEESFIKSMNLFSDLKLRASYGVTGNQGISPYGSFASMASGENYPYNGYDVTDVGYAISRVGNPNLKWESTAQTDLGIDLGLFRGRLSATVDYYIKKTSDLLLQSDLPRYSGLNTRLANVGSTKNEGIEISISGDPFVGNFKWNSGFNISANKNTVVDLGGKSELTYRTTQGGYGLGTAFMRLRVGEPWGQMYGWECLGTWKQSEAAEAALYGQLPGDQKWKDVPDAEGVIDHKITDKDIKVIGNAMPKFIFGWTNRFSLKNFDLTVLIQGSQGNDVFNMGRIRLESMGEGSSTRMLDHWTIDNQDTDVPAFTDYQTRAAAGLVGGRIKMIDAGRSSRWIEDGSYVRIKNITLAYNIPESLLTRVGVSRLRIYASGTNLITLTKYTGYDPEVSSFNSSDAVMGIDYSNYPTARTVTFGLDITL
jgi:TonB-linked SusC/RagA family outer membrane protein